ncbi:DAK2 domain-containing protein [Alkalicoccus chagannorensis]|uniref:DAK2 domain-containing protein n=1 Tax=Alkalicoccus chagannorensis TaxID=427072 RepID=UPI0003F7B82A|nr:DAK2 domain-containing protein [Alkalicoccus chagannorensis]
MAVKVLDGEILSRMFRQGAAELSRNAQKIDALNVFPVPDGDTGTNMNLTITSGVKEMQGKESGHAGTTASAFAKGLLMGARGNSGVILSQLFRGFSKEVEKQKELEAPAFAAALQNGVDTAYRAVMKPVEGTILTVAKDAASAAVEAAEKEDDIVRLMEIVQEEAAASLERTPELLPVLKEVGVVDSGGQGLLSIYDGFLSILNGKPVAEEDEIPSMDELVKLEHHQSAQGHMATEDIEFGYCTEVMVQFDNQKLEEHPYDEQAFREELSEHGDSLLVVSDEDLLKIHIHVEYPGKVIDEAQRFGSLVNVKVENMREQHSNIVQEDRGGAPAAAAPQTGTAVITVGMGAGIRRLFEGLGVRKVIEGGQTMNPSTEDFIKAIEEVNASRVILLPNNSNIVMAAEQAADVTDVEAEVVPTKTVPEGLAAMLAFDPEAPIAETAEAMGSAVHEIQTGEVTYAVRDTSLDGVEISEGDYMGIKGKKIVSCGSSVQDVAKELIHELKTADTEIITIIYGEDRTQEEAETLASWAEEQDEEIEVEVHSGEQPLYSYIISAE